MGHFVLYRTVFRDVCFAGATEKLAFGLSVAEAHKLSCRRISQKGEARGSTVGTVFGKTIEIDRVGPRKDTFDTPYTIEAHVSRRHRPQSSTSSLAREGRVRSRAPDPPLECHHPASAGLRLDDPPDSASTRGIQHHCDSSFRQSEYPSPRRIRTTPAGATLSQ